MSPEGPPTIKVDRERAVYVIETCLKERAREGSPLNIELPEKEFIDLIINHAEEIGDERFVSNALFFVTSLVLFQETFDFFARIMANKELLDEYAWIFQPEAVLAKVEAGMKIEDVVKACKTFLQPRGIAIVALGQWVHNCEVLYKNYGGDIRNFFKKNENDAVKIVKALVVSPRAKSYQKPELRRFGQKLAPLFLQWVGQYDLYPLENIDEIGVPTDWQICRVAVQTGILTLTEPTQVHRVVNGELRPLLADLCIKHGWPPREVSATLWLTGNQLCTNRRHNDCPVSEECTILISRGPFDAGKVDPTDVGRFDP